MRGNFILVALQSTRKLHLIVEWHLYTARSNYRRLGSGPLLDPGAPLSSRPLEDSGNELQRIELDLLAHPVRQEVRPAVPGRRRSRGSFHPLRNGLEAAARPLAPGPAHVRPALQERSEQRAERGAAPASLGPQTPFDHVGNPAGTVACPVQRRRNGCWLMLLIHYAPLVIARYSSYLSSQMALTSLLNIPERIE